MLTQCYPAAELRWCVLSSPNGRASETRRAATMLLPADTRVHFDIRDFRESYFPHIGAQIKEYFESVKQEFSPDVVDAVAAARLAAVASHAVRIETEPPGALVSVDGKDLGRTPVELSLGEGQHVIVARSPLHEPATRGVQVSERKLVTLELAPHDDAIRIS